ncbi:hypothetical protein Glove_520g19 [Diversispora epigaea]|uniref:Uncharacterized protein n=1 Tax=Diversispora epigaea TaxID=1348612 RepID=A0A397GNA7_9GLOM|nr:hypothetical protein Glove_520g19 [Diversispora epigaea]
MKVLNIRTTKPQTHFVNFNKFWDQRYLLLLFLIATYITFELFYDIKDDLNAICRETSRHKPSDRKLTTIPYTTTTYTQNHYHHHHKNPLQHSHRHNHHHHHHHKNHKTLNDSQLNFKFCANEDKCKFLFPYQPHFYNNSKHDHIQFLTFINLAQLLNRIIVLPHIITHISNVSVNNGNNTSFPFYSCDLIRKFGNHSNPIFNNNINGTAQENEINLNEYDNKLLKKLFPNVRFITQHEFQVWSKSRIHKPKIIHELISVGKRKFQNIEILSHHHYDPYIREWLESYLSYYNHENIIHKHENKNNNFVIIKVKQEMKKKENKREGNKINKNKISKNKSKRKDIDVCKKDDFLFKKINFGISSFASRKSVKEATQFLLKELKNDVEVLLLAHDLKFRKFYKVFSSIYNSSKYLSIEMIKKICMQIEL